MTIFSSVQSAIYAALSGDSPPLAGSIADHPVQPPVANAAYPIIEIGDYQSLPDDGSCDAATTDFINIHIWSRYAGNREALDIAERIRELLHQQNHSVSGLVYCHSYIDSIRVLDDADGLTRHGIVTVRLNCQRG